MASPSAAHAARTFVISVALLLSAPAAAQGVTGALYPLQATGIKAAELTRVQRLVLRGLKDAERDGMLALSPKTALPAECGAGLDVLCMARFAGQGLVLYGEVRRSKGAAAVVLRAVDQAGNVYGPERLSFAKGDTSSAPVEEAVATLTQSFLAGAWELPASKTHAAARAQPLPAEPPAATPPPAAAPPLTQAPRDPPTSAQPPLAPAPPTEPLAQRPSLAPRPPAQSDLVLPKPSELAARSASDELEEAPRRSRRPAFAGSWKRTAGPIVTGSGLAILTAGVVVGLLDRDLATSLDEKYRRFELTAEDGPRFQQVRTYNTVANVCFAAGALTSAAGIYLWATAPSFAPRRGGGQLLFRRSF